MQKTLIFGGAFDPPHIEHVNVCKHAMQELGIHRLVIVPTYQPPHKSAGVLDFATRCELIKRAYQGLDVIIDDIEYVKGEDNYSAYNLPILKEKYGDVVYLIGGDSFEWLDTWFKPQSIVNTCPIAVVGRDGYDNREVVKERLISKFGGEYILLDYVGKDISSSNIRAKLLLCDKPDEIDDSVYEYIVLHNLFDKYKDIVERLKSYQSDRLFEHSKAVTLTAIDLNSKHHLKQDFDKVFVASLLHDNAKERPSLDGFDVPKDAVGTSVLHQFLGKEKARRDFSVEDSDILDAIECHTTAKGNMTTFEKLIYTADSVSYDRDYSPIPTIRDIAFDDFEKGFKAVLQYTYDKLIAKGGNIYPMTLDAVNCYLHCEN